MKRATGTREWSEHSANWQVGCSHGCLYCYARANALRFKRLGDPAAWIAEMPNNRLMDQAYRMKRKGVIMCPTTHDITPHNLELSVDILHTMAQNGNHLLIVSKPHSECIEALTNDLAPFRDRVEFRFSIGCKTDGIAEFWEPCAPSIQERLDCIPIAISRGFRVSISCEPLLEPWHVQAIVNLVRFMTLGNVWIGCLKHLRERTAWALNGRFGEEPVMALERWQKPEMMQKVCDALKGIPGIRFKDSYQRVLGIDSYGRKEK